MEPLYLFELRDIDLEEIDKGKLVIGEVYPDKLSEKDITFLEVLKFKVEINVKPKKISVRGEVHTVIELVCDKCLDSFRFPVKDYFDYIFFLEKLVVDKKHKEFRLRKEDLEIDFIEENVLPLKDMIVGQIYLNIPIKKVCSESCKGLCPVCGKNLNYETCSCKQETSFSPFAKLKDFKIDKGRNRDGCSKEEGIKGKEKDEKSSPCFE